MSEFEAEVPLDLFNRDEIDYREFSHRNHLRRLQEEKLNDGQVFEDSDPICPLEKLSKDKFEFFEEQCFISANENLEECVLRFAEAAKTSPYPPNFSSVGLSIENAKTKKKNLFSIKSEPCDST